MSLLFFFCWSIAATCEVRVKRQEEDEGPEAGSIDELCHDRPADEYFRLSTEGDCRDVVR